MQSFKDFKAKLVETSLGRILQHSNQKEYPIGIVTASIDDTTISALELRKLNDKNNRALAAKLELERRDGKIGGFFIVDGFYTLKDGRKVKDNSYFVIGVKDDNEFLKKLIIELGRKYKQESVLYKPADTNTAKLIFMSDLSELKLGRIHPNKASEFYSKLRSRPGSFVFGE